MGKFNDLYKSIVKESEDHDDDKHCPECGDVVEWDGSLDSFVCPGCFAEYELSDDDEDLLVAKGDDVEEECSICSGTGRLRGRKCPTCSGTGTVIEKEINETT